jgi:CO dehydrogenase maturation factor
MKVAVSGKGGTGKTTIAATLARCLARRGHRVLAIDGDSNPNLAMSLGIEAALADAMRPMPARVDMDATTVNDLTVSTRSLVRTESDWCSRQRSSVNC